MAWDLAHLPTTDIRVQCCGDAHLLNFGMFAAPFSAAAQAPYPNQGVRFIVPYAPGGLPDTVARITAQHLQERIGQSVVVENRAGGGAAA